MSVHVCCEESRPGFATAESRPKGGQQNGSNGPSRWAGGYRDDMGGCLGYTPNEIAI